MINLCNPSGQLWYCVSVFSKITSGMEVFEWFILKWNNRYYIKVASLLSIYNLLRGDKAPFTHSGQCLGDQKLLDTLNLNVSSSCNQKKLHFLTAQQVKNSLWAVGGCFLWEQSRENAVTITSEACATRCQPPETEPPGSTSQSTKIYRVMEQTSTSVKMMERGNCGKNRNSSWPKATNSSVEHGSGTNIHKHYVSSHLAESIKTQYFIILSDCDPNHMTKASKELCKVRGPNILSRCLWVIDFCQSQRFAVIVKWQIIRLSSANKHSSMQAAFGHNFFAADR